MQGYWYPPVPIEFGRIGLIRNVTSAREAAECMLSERWPGDGGAIDRDARTALLAAMESTGEVSTARERFRTAAEAAGILVERAGRSRG